MSAMLVCALLLVNNQPLPASLAQMYQHAYNCSQQTPVAPATPARIPAQAIKHYFPGRRRIWPVVAWYTPHMLSRVKRIRKTGARPALLLPALVRFDSNSGILDRLHQAVRLGAVPVATLRTRTVAGQHDALLYWCSLDMCPAAWYIPDGISLHLLDLKSGLYLTGPHWRGHPDWPVPARLLRLDSHHRLLPLYHHAQAINGTAAAFAVPDKAIWFMPRTAPYSWHFWGFDLERRSDGLQGNAVALFLLGASGLAVFLWSHIASISTTLVLYVTHLFTWLWLWVLAINLAVLAVSLFVGFGLKKRGEVNA